MGGRRKTLGDKIAEVDAKIEAVEQKADEKITDLRNQREVYVDQLRAKARADKMREVADALEDGDNDRAARLMSEARELGSDEDKAPTTATVDRRAPANT